MSRAGPGKRLIRYFSRWTRYWKKTERKWNACGKKLHRNVFMMQRPLPIILEKNPKARYDRDELRKIAKFEVDEIHIIDERGEIVSGTHPRYYGYNFDSGEQIRFFKPMLNDKGMKMVQGIKPNTAENKLMQYSAMWNSTGEFIVEVGFEPVNVSKVTAKNELPYIFSQLCVNPDK